MGFNPRGHIEGQNAEELRYILLHKVASDPTAIAAVEAQFYYNTTSQVVKYRNSSAWVFLPYVTASLTTSALLQGTGYAISSFTNGTGSTGFVKVNTSSVPSLQQYVAFADINSSAICTSIVAPGDNITLTTEKAVVDYVTSQISAIPTVSPAGNDTEIQYNNAGNFGANASLTYNNTSKLLLLSNTSSGTFPTFKIKNGALEGYMWCEDDGIFYISSTGGIDIVSAGTVLSGAYLGLNSTQIYFDAGTPSKFLALTGAKYLTYLDAVVPADISGTANYLSKFTGTHTLGNSVLYESSSKIGINNTSPAYALDVKSQIAVTTTTELPTLSAELNTNPAGWTCSAALTNNGDGTYTKSSTTGTLSTNITVTNGRRYLISWSGITSLVTITLGAVSITKTSQTTVHACDITAGASGSLSLSIFFNSTNTGVVSNISIKELTPITSRIISCFTHVTSAGNGLELRTNKTLNSIALGINALSYLYSGVYNTAFGSNSLSNLTVGNYNTAFGYASLSSLTSGEFNTAIGYNALRDCTIGNNLVAIGTYAGEKITTAGRSVIIGSGAGRNVTTQGNNVLIGYAAGGLLNSSSNVCIGDLVYSAATSNGGTTAIGTAAGINATGASHTLVGYYAGGGLSTGNQNNAFGLQALYGITTGSRNLGLGSYSGTLNAIPEFYLNQSDAFGNDQDSIFIGYGASKQKLGSVLDNSIVIGNYARAYQNNQVVLGDVTNTSTYLRGKTEIYNHQILGTDSCANGSFTTSDYWTATGDIAFNTNKFTYTHSSGIGTLEQTSANRDAYGLAIKPNQWYKLSFNINHVSGTGTVSGSINASLNGTVVTMTTILSSGERYLYFKTGASTGNLKLEFASTGTRVFDITYVRLQEITGGDLYVNNDIEQRRGTYQYFRQYFGTDTDGDWRTYCDGSGLYVEYRTGGAWVNKHTISA